MSTRLVIGLYALGIILLVLSLVAGIFVKSEAVYLGIALVGFALCGVAAFYVSE